MKKLELNQMENLGGGICIKQSDVQCGVLGFLYGFANPVLGAVVGFGCSVGWGGENPVLYGCK